jgi:small subunit ribosomal protein S20
VRAVANIKSQIKRNRQNEVRHERNKAVRSELKTRIKRASVAAQSGAQDSAELLVAATRKLDIAASKGIIHPRQAARRKSRLVRRVASLQAGDAAQS